MQFELFDLTPGVPRPMSKKRATKTAKEKRDAAIKRVQAGADQDFLVAADKAIRKTATELGAFIVDAVWDRMPVGVHTPDNRAMGAAIKRAVKEGVISATNQYEASWQPQCHGNPRRVWRSNVFRG